MTNKDDVLAAMGGVPDLSRLIPASFRARFQLAEPMQYGMVCRDFPDKIARLEALGAGPFVHGEVRRLIYDCEPWILQGGLCR